jgi:probable F420-dependent oxidoreductase
MDFGVRVQDGNRDFTPARFQAERAEELGFDAVYLPEHTGFEPYWPSPLIGLAAIAARTETITVGTHVTLLPQHDPVRLAGDIACLDVLADGRTRFGFGVGWRESEFDAHGVPFEERGPRTDEYFDLLDRLLRGDTLSFDGDFVSLSDFRLYPEPVQTPRPELHAGGWSEPALRRSVELADGWMSPGGAVDRNVEFVERYRDRADGRVTLGTEGMVIREDRQAAYEAARRFLVRRKFPHIKERNELRIDEAFFDHLDAQGIEYDVSTEDAVLDLARRYVEFETGGDIERYQSGTMFLAGTPEDCIEWIAGLEEELAPDELIFRLNVHGFGRQATERTLELLGSDVLPSVT